ncbi:pentapeptide repeat protein [Desulfofarcimen acetoxidans DSM 771]|uniref:Pentapeptide repeat protein n=1 Tax=Desulfofarcimen acetoxidans (strain ATCC 49208 / DSM 771 / KCTC 5769 / VKM B-1644 / 5575) TaxID=485916 RepID=C8W6B9_DESAS|nr:pentapeptide repeat-containing protein [Desulfofarcimen acetoxidans]ACV62208.1 pentapeptide repeat protein [Desulfofarcimen acetoxidans DSM 771]
MNFIGKWNFSTPDNAFIGIDSGGKLIIYPKPVDGMLNFNAYGSNSKFMLQSAVLSGTGAGKYVEGAGDNYQASLEREGAVYNFALEDAGNDKIRIVDFGINGQGTDVYYLNVSGQTLGRVKKDSNPPSTTLFTQTVVTNGLDFIQKWGGEGADFTWVYFGGVQFSSGVRFSNATLSYCNFEAAVLLNARFQTTQLDHTNFKKAALTGANLNNACLNNSDLTGAFLSNAVMNQIKCREAVLEEANLSGTSLNDADFTSARLRKADFTKAIVNGVNLTDTDLREVKMSNPKDPGQWTIYMKNAVISSKTNFAGAQMQYLNLTGQNLDNVVFAHTDLTGSAMDNTRLNHADLSYANLSNVSITGNIPMHGANLSNSVLSSTNLTGAQMGSLSVLFRITDQTGVAGFKKALQNSDTVTVKKIFADNGVPLEGDIVINSSQYAPERVWEVRTATKTYTVRLEIINNAEAMVVYETVTAAIIENAYMMNAVLTSANLYNVRASGIQLFGPKAKLDGNAILEKAQFDASNLSGLNLKQALLYGINLNYSNLVGAQLQGAKLGLDSDGGQATLKNSNLQGADFSDASLDYAMFTDAAVSVGSDDGMGRPDGVWLFSAPSDQTEVCLQELENSKKLFNMPIEMEQNLQPGKVSPELRDAFAQHDVELSADALVCGQEIGFQWQITDGNEQYLIYEGCDQQKYTPALIVDVISTSESFPIPLSLKSDLKNGPVSNLIKVAFETYGSINLTDRAWLTVQPISVVWQVVDSNINYTLWRGLDMSCSLALFARPSLSNVTALFGSRSVVLSQRAQVTANGTGKYMLDNDSNNPYNPLNGYIRFNVIKNGNVLDVYGYAVRILATGADNQQEYKNIICEVTKLSENELTDQTVCPNSAFTRTNKANMLPFRQWMRARVLPRPPVCIPSLDGTYYCPNSVEGGM